MNWELEAALSSRYRSASDEAKRQRAGYRAVQAAFRKDKGQLETLVQFIRETGGYVDAGALNFEPPYRFTITVTSQYRAQIDRSVLRALALAVSDSWIKDYEMNGSRLQETWSGSYKGGRIHIRTYWPAQEGQRLPTGCNVVRVSRSETINHDYLTIGCSRP